MDVGSQLAFPFDRASANFHIDGRTVTYEEFGYFLERMTPVAKTIHDHIADTAISADLEVEDIGELDEETGTYAITFSDGDGARVNDFADLMIAKGFEVDVIDNYHVDITDPREDDEEDH